MLLLLIAVILTKSPNFRYWKKSLGQSSLRVRVWRPKSIIQVVFSSFYFLSFRNSINSGLRKIDSLETQNVHPKKIQILKRPPHEVQEQKKANAKKMFPPRKTYEQREREYAEARLRIFGEPEKVEVEKYRNTFSVFLF